MFLCYLIEGMILLPLHLYNFSELYLILCGFKLSLQLLSLFFFEVNFNCYRLSSKVECVCRYGESDGYPSQEGITYDAQVCWFLYVLYFTGSIFSQFLQMSYVLGCTWSSSSEERHWHIQDSYLWKIFRRCCGRSSCKKQSWQGSHFTKHHNPAGKWEIGSVSYAIGMSAN